MRRRWRRRRGPFNAHRVLIANNPPATSAATPTPSPLTSYFTSIVTSVCEESRPRRRIDETPVTETYDSRTRAKQMKGG